MGDRQSGGDFRQPADGAPLEVGHEQHGQEPEDGKEPRDNEHRLVGALHRLQLLRPLQGQGLFDRLATGWRTLWRFRRRGVGFLAAALDGELRGVKLFLDLQVGAQHVLGVRFVRLPR